MLLLLGVSERTIMGVMGWSNTVMAHRYAHVVDPIRNDVARRIDGLLWAATETETETTKANADSPETVGPAFRQVTGGGGGI